MRFKAIVDEERFSVLLNIVQALEKVGDACAVLLGPDELIFCAQEDSGVENLHLYAELTQAEIFADYRIDSKTGNQIMFTLQTTNLSRALSSGKQASEVILKLSKKNGSPQLLIKASTYEMIEVNHEVPIAIAKISNMNDHYPPKVQAPQVQLQIPQLRQLRAVMERMKNFEKTACLEANTRGEMSFAVTTDSLTIRTFYRDLNVTGDEPAQEEDMSQGELDDCCVKLDIKKFLKAIHFQALFQHLQKVNYAVIFKITQEQAIVVEVPFGPEPGQMGFMQYTMPVQQPE